MIIPDWVIKRIEKEILGTSEEGWCDDCIEAGRPDAYAEGVEDVLALLNDINFQAIVGDVESNTPQGGTT